MPGKITFTIKGAREMENLLKQLGPAVARRVGNNALRAAAKPIVDEARRLCPKGRKRVKGKTLSQSIRAELFGTGNNGALLIKIGASRPAGSHAHLLEYGHRIANQYGEWGFQPAQPFLRPAMDARAQAALREMGRVLAKGIDDQARALDKGRR